MSLQSRQRQTKDINCNQNYLNFIKKNQILIHEEMHHLASPKTTRNIQNSSTIYKQQQIQQNRSQNIINHSQHEFHNTFSKFHIDNNAHLSQVSKIYSIGVDDKKQRVPYFQTVGSEQPILALLHMRAKHVKNETNRQLILAYNKNKSIEKKKNDAGQQIDRYRPNLSVYAQTNFKFPLIDKKNAQAIKEQVPIQAFREQIRERMTNLMNKSMQKKNSKNDKSEQKKKSKDKITISNRLRMRQQLYGLLPIFRTPSKGHRKNNSSFSQNNKDGPVVSQKSQNYLQKKITTKMVVITRKQTPKQTSIVLQKKQELQLIENIDVNDFIKPQLQTIEKEGLQKQQQNKEKDTNQAVEIRNKQKKQLAFLTDSKYEGELTVYDLKIRSYRQFLFMVNLAHRIFDPIHLKDINSFKPEHRYKYHLGKGNNYLLVKSLLKRRFWWTTEEDPKKSNFLWTQLKLNYFYQYQRKSCVQSIHYKLDKDFPLNQSPKNKKSKSNQQPPVKAGVFKAPLPPNDKKIFTNSDKHYYDEFLNKMDNPQKMLKFSNRLKYFEQNLLRARTNEPVNEKIHNHLEYNYFIGNKKALFYNLKHYYQLQKKNVFEIIPLTFHIKNGTTDPQYDIFTKQFKRLAKEKFSGGKNISKNIWIVKPGQLSNRGQGITVIDQIYELNNILKKKQKHSNGLQKTYIVQKYIQKPLLYKNRKFDIRHYMMISRLHGVMRAYWFGQGYIRTSSCEFNISDIGESIIHLTNDAIQKYSQGYGKYEEGNKVSYNQFQRYMDSTYGQGKFSFSEMIYPRMRAIALDAVKATYLQLDPNNAEHNFQIFGLDFMIDASYNVWLIEVNTNPCLQLSSKLLARIIPTMVEQSFRLTLDVIFPPPTHYPNSQKYLAPDNPLERLQFELIFDENRDGKEIQQLFSNSKHVDMGNVDEQDQTYQNDGKQIELDNEIQ